MLVQSWGGFPKINSRRLSPRTYSDCISAIGESLIPRGAGRSYGDSALSSTVLCTQLLDRFIEFDQDKGTLTAQSGVTLHEILEITVPRGWFLHVTPGTSAVTLGGAVAADVHGKNHHHCGTFSQYVYSIRLLIGTGDVLICSPSENEDLFQATCGGMGLTGIILSVTLQLQKISSSLIQQTTYKLNGLEEICEKFSDFHKSTYSVAWLDGTTGGSNSGRGLLMLGEHSENGPLNYQNKSAISIPFCAPKRLLNKQSIGIFNSVYFHKNSKAENLQTSLSSYFYPLDAIENWNRLYGSAGFIQYQCVVPETAAINGIKLIFDAVYRYGFNPFLSVVKKLGPENHNPLSFPMTGYTLSVDIQVSEGLRNLVSYLDHLVIELGGRVYLAKDALLKEDSFKRMYPKWQHFEAIREKYGAFGRFSSAQSIRLGLR